jgi:hypothetical protein
MKGAYGFLAYGIQGSKGTPAVAITSPVGIVGNLSLNATSGVDLLKTVGSISAAELAEGKTSVDFSVSIAGVQDPHFIQQAKQVVGAGLPWLTFKVGYKRGAVQMYAVAQDCKIGSASLRLEAGGGLTADLSATGILRTLTAGDPGTMPFMSAHSYRWYNAQWSQLRDLYGFEFTVNNNLSPTFVIPGSATVLNPLRGPFELDEGVQEITGRARFTKADAAVDMQACLLTSSNETMTFQTCTAVSPAETMVLQLNGFKQTGDNWTIPADGNIDIDGAFQALSWDLTG